MWLSNLKRRNFSFVSFLILILIVTLQPLLHFSHYLEVPQKNIIFFLVFSRTPNPTWRTRVFLYVGVITFVMLDTEGPTNIYVTDSTSIRIVWPRKTNHWIQAGIPRVGCWSLKLRKFTISALCVLMLRLFSGCSLKHLLGSIQLELLNPLLVEGPPSTRLTQ